MNIQPKRLILNSQSDDKAEQALSIAITNVKNIPEKVPLNLNEYITNIPGDLLRNNEILALAEGLPNKTIILCRNYWQVFGLENIARQYCLNLQVMPIKFSLSEKSFDPAILVCTPSVFIDNEFCVPRVTNLIIASHPARLDILVQVIEKLVKSRSSASIFDIVDQNEFGIEASSVE